MAPQSNQAANHPGARSPAGGMHFEKQSQSMPQFLQAEVRSLSTLVRDLKDLHVRVDGLLDGGLGTRVAMCACLKLSIWLCVGLSVQLSNLHPCCLAEGYAPAGQKQGGATKEEEWWFTW